MKRKYELTKTTVKVGDRVLHRIRALKTFGDVKKGDLGGWVEKENNLSQEGDCWIYDEARVYGDARVFGNANVSMYASVFDNAEVYEHAEVFGNAEVSGNARIFGVATLFGCARVSERAQVYGYASVGGLTRIIENARIFGTVRLWESVTLCGDLKMHSMLDFITVGPIGPRNDRIVFSNNGVDGSDVYMCCDGFYEKIEDFEKEVVDKYAGSRYEKEYLAAIELAKIRFPKTAQKKNYGDLAK